MRDLPETLGLSSLRTGPWSPTVVPDTPGPRRLPGQRLRTTVAPARRVDVQDSYVPRTGSRRGRHQTALVGVCRPPDGDHRHRHRTAGRTDNRSQIPQRGAVRSCQGPDTRTYVTQGAQERGLSPPVRGDGERPSTTLFSTPGVMDSGDRSMGGEEVGRQKHRGLHRRDDRDGSAGGRR